MTNKQRDRGRILTPEALAKLQHAIRGWEVKHEKRCTQERMKELTSEFKEGGLDPGTISKILKGKGGVDPESIRCLFNAFGLVLEEADLVASTPFVLQVDPNFVGREGAIVDLNILLNRGAKVIVIQARGGVGKTTLARKYLQQEFDSVLEFPIAKETKDIASIESLIEEKLRQLGEEPGREFLVSIDRLKRKLQAERLGILIDNLEPALDAAGKFIEPHRRYVELLRVLADPSVQSITLITSRERLHEPSVTVQHYPLRSLDTSAWEQFFQLHQLSTSTPALAALHHAYGGNAKAMEIISSVIQTDYSGDLEAYWHENQDDLLIERDLEDLVTNQLDRLQEVDPDAYKLLCRMGCYRYQDVPTVPTEGVLCLLWDVSESRQKRVIRSLQERSLVEFEDGEYWLHPVIRAEAIQQLRRSEEWKVANNKAAEIWTESIERIETVENALKALEAYYHYVEVQDFNSASNVILKFRPSEKGFLGFESLGRTFYRLGLCVQMSSAIIGITDKLCCKEPLIYLNHILGDLQATIGSIHYAVQLYRDSGALANEFLQNHNDEIDPTDLSFIQIESLFNIGICKMQLGEIEQSVTYIEEALLRTDKIFKEIYFEEKSNKKYKSWCELIKICVWSCLALLYSETNHIKKANLFINEADSLISNSNIFSDMSMWVKGFCLLSLGSAYKNLNGFEKALEVYEKGIIHLGDSDYLEIKANILSGMAMLYQKQKRFQIALIHHLESIKILEKIGAKCDLAEAFYQLGLTYKVMNEDKKSSHSFQEAIRLFSEMEAPRQVERVMRSMEERN